MRMGLIAAAAASALVSEDRAAWRTFGAESAGEYRPPRDGDIERLDATPQVTSDVTGDMDSQEMIVPVVEDDAERWEAGDQSRFAELAALEAEGHASAAEIKELDRLQARRRNSIGARSADEIMFDHTRSKLIRRIERSLDDYAVFIRPTR